MAKIATDMVTALKDTITTSSDTPTISKNEPGTYTVILRADKTYVAGRVKTSDGHKYELKVLLGPKFPDEMPHLLLTSPDKADKYGSGLIVNEGLSHRFHSRGKGLGGHLEICHCNNSLWDPSRTITSILIKGAIWCEAHRRHIKTGRSIAEYCDELRDQVPDILNDYQPH
jgi:hypothetical protein